MRSFHAVVPLLCFLCSSAVADLGPYEDRPFGEPSDEQLARTRLEAWALQYFAAATLPLAFGPAKSMEPGSLAVDLELADIPRLDKAERTIGFSNTRSSITPSPQNLNTVPVLFRPSLRVGLPANFDLSVSVLPPTDVFEARPQLYSLALDHTLWESERFRVGWRAFAQYGRVDGSFVCDDHAVAAPAFSQSNPYGCLDTSHDTVRFWNLGAQLSIALKLHELGGIEPYLGVNVHYQDLLFKTDNRNQVTEIVTGDSLDRRELYGDFWNWGLTGGLRWPFAERHTLSVGVSYQPLDVRRPDTGEIFTEVAEEDDSLIQARIQYSFAL